jgi:large subunit ribosomal protein L3
MISGFLVKKGRMTSVYNQKGNRVGVTRCSAAPLKVTQLKNKEKDGYQSVQIAFDSKRNIDKAVSKKMSKLKLDIKPRFFQEFKLTSDKIPELGSDIAVDTVLKAGDKIDATGKSKGHGFAGVIKRHGFHKQPRLGSSDRIRHPGSIGAQTPGKVIKGKKMPGHYGNKNMTVTNLEVFSVDPEKNEILIQGSVPGAFNSWITIKKVI